jgi:hypothetical protein
LLIKPNPAANEVEVRIAGVEEGEYSITLTDMQGRELWAEPKLTVNEMIRVQTRDFVPGIYFIIARRNESHLYREKLIIIR